MILTLLSHSNPPTTFGGLRVSGLVFAGICALAVLGPALHDRRQRSRAPPWWPTWAARGGVDREALFIDGKRFADRGVVVALGVDSTGKKHVLGIYQCSTENSEACLGLLADLERRGLPESNLLFVVDGGSGLNKALEKKYQCPTPRRDEPTECVVMFTSGATSATHSMRRPRARLKACSGR